jgi:hypothetical protein
VHDGSTRLKPKKMRSQSCRLRRVFRRLLYAAADFFAGLDWVPASGFGVAFLNSLSGFRYSLPS